jgi:hypothetical protein
MLIPLWLALSASLTLHVGILLMPGWELPLDDAAEPVPLAATLTAPPPVAKAATTVTKPPVPVRRRPPPRPAPEPSAAQPAASMPDSEAPTQLAAATEPESETASPEPAAAPAAAPTAVPPTPVFASRWPRTGRIVYQVMRGTGGFIVGQSEQRWEHDGQRYSLHAEIETTGLAALFQSVKIVQDSRGVFDAAGLRPLEYAVVREGKPQGGARFEPEQGRIVLQRGGSASFVPGAQDLLSIFYQLAALSLDTPGFPLTVTTGRKVATFAVVVGAEEALELPLGTRRTRHLRVTGNAREDATEIWLDAETRLPLKIRHRDTRGDLFDQVATLIETETKP